MFARTARVLTVERRPAMQAPAGQAFSNESDRLNAARRRRRPVLLCRWQLDPASGRPFCVWHVECPDVAPDLEPDLDIDPSWPMQARPLFFVTSRPSSLTSRPSVAPCLMIGQRPQTAP
jgi:hypothetical protein